MGDARNMGTLRPPTPEGAIVTATLSTHSVRDVIGQWNKNFTAHVGGTKLGATEQPPPKVSTSASKPKKATKSTTKKRGAK